MTLNDPADVAPESLPQMILVRAPEPEVRLDLSNVPAFVEMNQRVDQIVDLTTGHHIQIAATRTALDTLAASVESDIDTLRTASSKHRDDIALFNNTQLAMSQEMFGLRGDVDSLNEQHHRDARAMWWTILALGLTALAAIFVAVVALNVAVDVANR